MRSWEFGIGYPTVEIKDDVLKFGRGFNLDKHIPLKTITGISYDGGGFLSGKYTVKIYVGGALGNSFETPKTQKSEKMIQQIIAAVDKYRDLKTAEPAKKTTDKENIPLVADELMKLASLLNAGALTQDEFDAQKKKILGS